MPPVQMVLARANSITAQSEMILTDNASVVAKEETSGANEETKEIGAKGAKPRSFEAHFIQHDRALNVQSGRVKKRETESGE